MHPFWSPDGQRLGFFTDGKLLTIAAAGGGATIVADTLVAPRGGSWGANDTIIYARNYRDGLVKVSARGGTPAQATKLDLHKHTTHRWPWFMPDGRHFVFFAGNHTRGNPAENGVYFGSVDSTDTHLVVAATASAEYASGYLLYQSQSAIVAQPFDPVKGTLSGSPVPLVNNIRYDAGVWRDIISASQNGLVAYQAGTGALGATQLTWFERTGKPLNAVGPKQRMGNIHISPDGRRVVYSSENRSSGGADIWTRDLVRGTETRVTFGEAPCYEASWSPDGKSVVYVAAVGGPGSFLIRVKAADGSGSESTIVDEAHVYHFPVFEPDVKF